MNLIRCGLFMRREWERIKLADYFINKKKSLEYFSSGLPKSGLSVLLRAEKRVCFPT